MPNPQQKRSDVYSKHIPLSIPWSRHIEYTFPNKNVITSTDTTQSYRFPSRRNTFWFNFRFISYSQNGILTTKPLPVQINLITADGRTYSIVSTRHYYPNRWYSTYWPIPAIYTAEDTGIYLDIQTSSDSSIRVELQGFEYAHPLSRHYVLIDENDRQRFLFKDDEPIRRGRIESGSIGSIHEIEEEDVIHTQGLKDVEGVPLFPMTRQETVWSIDT